jgi:hypothetical protein
MIRFSGIPQGRNLSRSYLDLIEQYELFDEGLAPPHEFKPEFSSWSDIEQRIDGVEIIRSR